ncbi:MULTISPECIES: hypothetical protein [Muribaculaceae]|uniref:hypothetical protein n=1 Tax=Muribaculaceae TaxID=2005473 RepID=UPI001C3C3ED3|nr:MULTISPECIES: hypothetical protein [Muribaculaceae]
MKKRHWKIKLKERTTGQILTPEYIGYKDREKVIEFFGLENQDVEWYEIEEVPCKEND